MRFVLVDTNIVSYLLKGDTRSEGYAPFLTGNRLAISFVTVAELYEWTAVRHWGANRIAQLDNAINTYLVISADIALCQAWGELRARQRLAGIALSTQDAWIAATALHYQIPLVTHNLKDFENIPQLEVWSALKN